MLGYRLRDARQTAGYTQRQLSDLLNLGESEIWRYENEKSRPSSDVVARIATALAVSSDFLIGISDDSTPKINISSQHWRIVAALQRGDKLGAIKMIVTDG